MCEIQKLDGQLKGRSLGTPARQKTNTIRGKRKGDRKKKSEEEKTKTEKTTKKIH